MKTSITFNKVINDAGQLAPTEGHTVLSSSPRVSPCGLLSFKGDIVKTQKYYTLVGLNTDHVWEIIFGDYDREVIEDEKSDQEDADCSDDYLSFKIIKTNEAQADIEFAVKRLNEKNSSWKKVQLSTKSASEIKKIIYDLTDHSNPLTSNTAR